MKKSIQMGLLPRCDMHAYIILNCHNGSQLMYRVQYSLVHVYLAVSGYRRVLHMKEILKTDSYIHVT